MKRAGEKVMKDYYKILDADRDYTKKELMIRIRDRKKTAVDDNEQEELREAQEIFRDKERRFEYDALLLFIHRKKSLKDELVRIQSDARISKVFKCIFEVYIGREEYSKEILNQIMSEIINGNKLLLEEIAIIKREYSSFYNERKDLIRKIEGAISGGGTCQTDI